MRNATLLFIFFLASIAFAQDDGVAPLVKVEWGQYDPYNAECPLVNGNRAAAGCSAIAIAQAMTVGGVPAIDVNDKDAVARFIYHCGEAINTNYGPSSSAFTSDILCGLISNMGYDRDMVIRTRDCYSAQEWCDVIRHELDDGRPVIFSATDSKNGAHSFVVDGYKSGANSPSESGRDILFHINWGWTGKENGYFDIDDLRTNDYYFDKNHSIITGFMPDNRKQERKHFWEASATMSATAIEQGDDRTVRIRLRIYNHYYEEQSMGFYPYLVSETGERISLSRYNKVYAMNIMTDKNYSKELTFTPNVEPGTYTLLVEYRPYAGFDDYVLHIGGDTQLTVLPSTSGIIEHSVSAPSTINEHENVFNLSGQRVSAGTRGIVIINGKKYVNK